MSVRVIVDESYCKGCGLCVEVCPKGILKLDEEKLTAKGYHPVMCIDESACNADGQCATMCPDVALRIVKE